MADNGKILSVALPPRRRSVPGILTIIKISEIADRVYVMAYDQHWHSNPGPVASLPGARTLSGMLQRQSESKLVMAFLCMEGHGTEITVVPLWQTCSNSFK